MSTVTTLITLRLYNRLLRVLAVTLALEGLTLWVGWELNGEPWAWAILAGLLILQGAALEAMLWHRRRQIRKLFAGIEIDRIEHIAIEGES